MTEQIIRVYIHFQDGEIGCLCLHSLGKCTEPYCDCEEDEVTYDQYRGWQECMKQDKYGK